MTGVHSPLLHPITLGIVIAIAVSAGLGVVLSLVLRTVIRRLQVKALTTDWKVDDLVLDLVRVIVPSYVLIGGIWGAIAALPLDGTWLKYINLGMKALLVAILTIACTRVAGKMVENRAVAHTGASGSATIFVNITRITVLSLGLLLMLNTLGIAITPVLTALGVGGLAVALALQDTLAQLFAGIHILASRQIQPGAYIMLDTGMEGYVQDTNWRNTIIRQTSNNFIVVPNDKLAKSIVTNYHQPDQTMSVTVEIGIGYESNLDYVEQVTFDVAKAVMLEDDGGVPEYEPLIRYTKFGDSSITCAITLRAAEATKRGLVTHQFIKRLHQRYRVEGIDIPFITITLSKPENEVPDYLALGERDTEREAAGRD